VIVEVDSRVKGQAGSGSDYDGGIVFKPEVPFEKGKKLYRSYAMMLLS